MFKEVLIKGWTKQLALRFALVAGMIMALPGPVTAQTPKSAAPKDRAGPTSVLVVGDSLSAEYGLARGTGWVALMAKKYSHLTIINSSISGETSSGGLTRLPALLEKHSPGLVIIELGGNDALRGLSLEMTKANLMRMTAMAQEKKSRVLLLGMQLPPNYGTYAKNFAQIYVDIARERKTALVPFFLQGIGEKLEYFQPDRIHPTEKAQVLLLNNVIPELDKLLK